MSLQLKPDYFYTSEGFRIFYSTNFSLKSYDSQIPLLVFNYGLVCNNEHWKYQLPFFDSLGLQILIHDYRFHYSSSGDENEIEKCTFEGMTQDIYEILDSFNAQNIFMLGHSMGVNITLECVKKFPDKIRGIVLISGSVLPPQEVMFDTNIIDMITPYVENIYETYPQIYKKFWSTNYLNPIARKVIFKGGFNTDQISEEFIQIYMKRIGELPPQIFLKLMRQMQKQEILKDLVSIKTPSLVMGGDKDKVIPNYLQQILVDKLPNSEHYIVKEGSHVPQADFPDSVNTRIFSFIEKHKK